MAKKKQPDFQPTKLRVGKHLPKGRNVTNTAFKSKKIVTKDQNLKIPTEIASLADLIGLTGHSKVVTKIDALKKITKYISLNDSSLPTYFAEVLKATSKLFLDFNSKVRQEALNVIKFSLDFLSDSQMSAFISVLTTRLDCMMTHVSLSIKKDSLQFLSSLLKTHPKVVCHSTKCLNNLLNMISSVKAEKGGSPSNKKRKLDDNISTTMTSVEWRSQVLKIITEFLENLINTYAKRDLLCEDEQKVYYDREEQLFIQLYAGGGLSPAKLDFDCSVTKSKAKVTEELKKFFCELVSVASDVVTEEIAGLNFSPENNILRPDNIEHLNTVTQVLCCIADWYNMGSRIEDQDFVREINNILSQKLMKGFCYRMHYSAFKKNGRKDKETACVYLNLGISSLYCFFIQGTAFENTQVSDKVIAFLCEVLNKEQYQDAKTTTFILKILKNLIGVFANSADKEKLRYGEALSVIFNHLCVMALRNKDRAVAEKIYSFFAPLTLDYDYKFLLDQGLLDTWISHCFTQIKLMNTNKKVLHCLNLMGSREYPKLMEILQHVKPAEILSLLKVDDEDYQTTVINLITHMTNLPPDFLRIVSKFILTEHQLNLKIVLKLIRSLFIRFNDQRVGKEEFIEFCRFLLNVAFDNISFEMAARKYNDDYYRGADEVSANEEEEYPEDLIHLLFTLQSPYLCYIVPTQHAERHLNIIEVCIECLTLYNDRNVILDVTSYFFQELSKAKSVLPVHSAMALLKLQPLLVFDGKTHPNEMVDVLSSGVVCSSLFYISVMTETNHPEECKAMGVGELIKALNSYEDKGCDLIMMIISRAFNQMEDPPLLHVLRIIKFLCIKNKFVPKNWFDYERFFCAAASRISENSPHRILLNQIYEFITQP